MADEQPKVNGTVLEVPYPVPADPVADDHLEAVKVSQPANGFTVDVPDDNKVKPIPATGISFTNSTVKVGVGNDTYANVNFAPDYTGDKTLTWQSSDTAVATVDKDGKITGVKDGTATITATAAGGKTATTNLVVGAVVPVTGVTLDKTTATVEVGANVTLTATVAPENATNKRVTWKSSDTSKATVSGGKVTGVAAGTATITATTDDGAKTATCAVTVNAPAA